MGSVIGGDFLIVSEGHLLIALHKVVRTDKGSLPAGPATIDIAEPWPDTPDNRLKLAKRMDAWLARLRAAGHIE